MKSHRLNLNSSRDRICTFFRFRMDMDHYVLNELNEFIEQHDSEMTEFDESLARRWLKEIVVWDDRFSVELKSGVRIEIDV